MSALFEELDYRQTVLGELILRRRRILKLDRDVVEVILNDEHLMSDMFTASEIALATLPMALLEAAGRTNADILVGGLGLGYTADAVLRSEAGRRFDGIFLDIDHSPDFHLNPSHAGFYSAEGLARLTQSLREGGIFALWSNDPPDEAFLARLRSVFSAASAEKVVFHNPLTDEDFVQTVYLGSRFQSSS